MEALSKKLDQYLLDLTWSLWTELGVAGVIRKHQNCLISVEELILLTALLAEEDPRLRDEALDWCTRYHHFISITRLRTLIKTLGPSVLGPFSAFAATLNSVSRANWPTFSSATAWKFIPSGKSQPPRCELPALLSLRVRALFGVGARADLITFFLTQEKGDFTASDTTEIGYNKRSLADLLDDFVKSRLFDAFTKRNQRYYSFIKCDQMRTAIGLLPEAVPSWRQILEVLLPLRNCIKQVEKQSASTKTIEVRNVLKKMEDTLRKLHLTPPPMQDDLLVYWSSFADWIIEIVQSFAQGDFRKNQEMATNFSRDETRIRIQFEGLFSNIESLNTHSSDQTTHSLFENYKKNFQRHLNNYLPKLLADDQRKIRELADKLLSLDKSNFTASLKEEIMTAIDQILEKY